MISRAATLALALAIALPLAGCGRKSRPIPPPDSQYPRTYPAIDFPGDPTAPAVEAQPERPPSPTPAPATPVPFEDLKRPGAP